MVGRRIQVRLVVVVVVRGGVGRMPVLPLLPSLFQEAEEGGCMGAGVRCYLYFGHPFSYHSPHHAGVGGHHGHAGGGHLGFRGGGC